MWWAISAAVAYRDHTAVQNLLHARRRAELGRNEGDGHLHGRVDEGRHNRGEGEPAGRVNFGHGRHSKHWPKLHRHWPDADGQLPRDGRGQGTANSAVTEQRAAGHPSGGERRNWRITGRAAARRPDGGDDRADGVPVCRAGAGPAQKARPISGERALGAQFGERIAR